MAGFAKDAIFPAVQTQEASVLNPGKKVGNDDTPGVARPELTDNVTVILNVIVVMFPHLATVPVLVPYVIAEKPPDEPGAATIVGVNAK